MFDILEGNFWPSQQCGTIFSFGNAVAQQRSSLFGGNEYNTNWGSITQANRLNWTSVSVGY